MRTVIIVQRQPSWTLESTQLPDTDWVASDLSTSLTVLIFQAAAGHSLVERRHLEREDLQSFSLKDLTALSKSLSQAIQGNHQEHFIKSQEPCWCLKPSSPVCPLLTTRPQFRAGDPPAGPRPAEDRAGRHVAGGPGSHVPLKQPHFSSLHRRRSEAIVNPTWAVWDQSGTLDSHHGGLDSIVD